MHKKLYAKLSENQKFVVLSVYQHIKSHTGLDAKDSQLHRYKRDVKALVSDALVMRTSCHQTADKIENLVSGPNGGFCS